MSPYPLQGLTTQAFVFHGIRVHARLKHLHSALDIHVVRVKLDGRRELRSETRTVCNTVIYLVTTILQRRQ